MSRLFYLRLLPCLVCFAFLAAASPARAQTIGLSAGVQTYASLSGATVVLTGKSELRLTAAAAALSGCTINLNSPDAWVLFTAVKPSVVVSTYLSQIRVGGAAAVSGSNVRVVQYELGAVVIPHAPSFQPLEAFTGRDFSGTSRTFGVYTYYNTTTALGAFNSAISSFRLKRGYMATFSTQTNGTGPSQIYVAQDADLEIGRLPASLDNAIRYVRVLPWRWISKKGSCDVDPTTLNASWHYNWDNNKSSALDWEYVPIRQQRWWPALPSNKPDSTHLSGFNEPDNPVEDSYTSLGNGSVDTAIAVWPELLASGLRVGSPAVTDGGLSWLYDFMTKADAARLRVDYVTIHFYRCGYTAQQLYDWLYAIHVQTGRPIWITEFNNGADWTSCADPSYAQNATRIAEFTDMMDKAPWIERYAVYSRVEYMRQMTYDTGGLTPAGVAYRDNASPMAYVQRLPRTGARALAQLSFEGDTLDASGQGNNAAPVGRPVLVPGRSGGQALRLDGDSQYLQLPPDVASSSAFSFAAWVYWDGGANWQRIFDFGRDTSRYAFLTASATGGYLRFATRNNGSEQTIQMNSALPVGQWSHVAFTLSGGTGRLYLNGAQVASGAISITPAQLSADLNYIGQSRFTADPLFSGLIDDVRIADYAFSPAQIAAMQGANTVPQFSAATIAGGSATQNQPFSGSLASFATDADAGDTLAFAKISGPAWLQVAADGTLSGTPGYANDGLQEFVVSVTDAGGASDSAVLTITMPVVIGNGTWLPDADGSWGEVANWSSAFPANGVGASANFSTVNISADRTVTLDRIRAIGSLAFGDVSGAQNWTLVSTDGASLILDTGTAAASTVTVNQNTATLALPLEGERGLTKAGVGTLVLAGGGTLAGTLSIDSGNTTSAQGPVRIAHPDAIADVATIQIRNNNSGSSTLELSAALGDIAAPAAVSVAGRNVSIAAIRNLSGENTLGPVSIQIGGTNYIFQSDSGVLGLGGLTSGASGARAVTFSGAGGFAVSGVVSNGSADTVSLVKNGVGRLVFSAANTFTGNITIGGGTLSVFEPASLYAGAWNNTAVLTINTGGTLELDRWGYGIANATYRTQALGGLSYNPARFIINGGTVRFTGGAAGAPQNPAEAPYGPGFTLGAAGATLEAAKAGDVWTVKYDSRGTASIVSSAGGTLTLAGVGDGIFDKVLPGTGALIKTGAGVWSLTQANTYSGPTNVQSGTLRVEGTTASSVVTVQSGATLAGTGLIGGPATVLAGGVLAPGSAGVGTLRFSGNLTLASGSVTRVEIDPVAGTRDQVNVSGALGLGGTLEVALLGGNVAVGDAFPLFTAASRSGAFAAVSLPVLPPGRAWDVATLSTDGVLRVVAAAVPDYASWAAGQSLPAGAAGAADDADGDGLANVFEWLFGGDPLAPDAAARLPAAAIRPLTTTEYPAAVEGCTYLTLNVRVRRERVGVTLIPEGATTLEGFGLPAAATAVVPLGAPVPDGDFDVLAYVFTTPIQDSPTHGAFMRVRAVLE